MQIHCSIKHLFVFSFFLAQQSALAENWFSNFMVKVPGVGYYFMDESQKQIYKYQQLQKEALQLRVSFYSKDVTTYKDEITNKIYYECRQLIPGQDNEKVDLIWTQVINLYNKKSEEVVKTDCDKAASIVDNYIKQKQNDPVLKEFARMFCIHEEMNKFKQTELYKKSVVTSLKGINLAIKRREEAFLESNKLPQDIFEKIKKKEYVNSYEKGSPERYYREVLRCYVPQKDTSAIDKKSVKAAIDKHIASNLEKLKKERSTLISKISTYKAIEE